MQAGFRQRICPPASVVSKTRNTKSLPKNKVSQVARRLKVSVDQSASFQSASSRLFACSLLLPRPRFARARSGKKALRAFFFSMAGLSIWAMYSLSPCPSPCIAFLYLPKGGFAPYWHLPPKCRQKKPPLFFAPIILRTSPRRGTADHPSAVRPAPRSPLLISRGRCPCGRVGA